MCRGGAGLGELGGAWARCIIPSCEDTAENRKPSCQCYIRFVVDTCICQGGMRSSVTCISEIWPVCPASPWAFRRGTKNQRRVCFSTVITTDHYLRACEDDSIAFNKFSTVDT